MLSLQFWAYATLSALSLQVTAHGFIDRIKIGDTEIPAYNPRSDIGVDMSQYPNHVGWEVNNIGSTFINKGNGGWQSDSIICHIDAKPPKAYATIAAGDELKAYWTNGASGWPKDHAGPLFQYLAPCPNNDCINVDKTQLKFSKIRADGLLKGGKDLSEQVWASSWVINNGSWQSIAIPKDIKAGKYVLRSEIVNGQFAYFEEDAQLYPSCINLDITGDGTTDLSTQGVYGKELYRSTDFHYDPNQPMHTFDIPGPPTYTPNGGAAIAASSEPPAAANPTACSKTD